MSADQPGKAEFAVLLGDALVKARVAAGLTQAQAAQQLPFGISALQKDEQGGDAEGCRGVNTARARAYGEAYGVTARELLTLALE